MSATRSLIGGAAGLALIAAPFAPFPKGVFAIVDTGKHEDPTKGAVAVINAPSTATNTPTVVWNTVTDEEYSVEPPGDAQLPKVTLPST